MKKRCCFAGHREINNPKISELIKNAVTELIEQYDVDEFWIGNYGDFDRISTRELNKLKKQHKNIEVDAVIPYTTKVMDEYREEYSQKYDAILMAEIPENTPYRYRIIKANEYMVDNSDYIICYVKYGWGGAAKTLEYAKRRKNIRIINLAESI